MSVQCENCGRYVGAEVNPITGSEDETLCYDCAQDREDRKREAGPPCVLCGASFSPGSTRRWRLPYVGVVCKPCYERGTVPIDEPEEGD
jgi:hypothetical protein